MQEGPSLVCLFPDVLLTWKLYQEMEGTGCKNAHVSLSNGMIQVNKASVARKVEYNVCGLHRRFIPNGIDVSCNKKKSS